MMHAQTTREPLDVDTGPKWSELRLTAGLAVLFAVGLLFRGSPAVADDAARQSALKWGIISPLPDGQGRVGVFAGVIDDRLIVAGGWQPATTSTQCLGNDPRRHGRLAPDGAYSEKVFQLGEPTEQWMELSFRLPQPVAYGASITWNGALICLGGRNAVAPVADAFLLRFEQGKLRLELLPHLPEAVSHPAAAMMEDTLYVAGGLGADGLPRRTFWALNLSERPGKRSWKTLETWSGSARSHAVAAVQEDAFWLFTGRGEEESPTHGRLVALLADAFRYRPQEGWRRVADPPFPVAGAASPGLALGQSHVILIGGRTVAASSTSAGPLDPNAALNGEQPNRTVLAYHTITNTWRPLGELPPWVGDGLHAETTSGGKQIAVIPPQSAPVVWWRDRAVIPDGVGPGPAASQVLTVVPQRTVARMSWLDYAMVFAYLGVLVAMGVYFSRRKQSTEDFFLAGRRVPWWAAGLSIFGTSISALTFMAIPALVYRKDWVYFLGNMMIVALAPVVIYFYLPFFRGLEVTSAYEYLEKRFNVAVRLLGSGAFLLYQLGRMGVVVYLPALALAAVTGFNVYWCIVLMGVLATLYTTLGGIEAVIWTDVIQVIILLGGAALSFVIIMIETPGTPGELITLAAAEGKLRAVNLTWDVATAGLWVVVIGNFFKFWIPYTSDQSIVQRYLTTADERQAARAIWTNALLSAPAWLMFFSMGTALWLFYRAHPELLNPMSRTDEIFPWFIAQQLPAGISGLVIAALFAAAMSSLDSSMNSMATVITTDFYRRFRPEVSDRAALWLARVATVLLGVVGTGFALYMATLGSTSVWDQFLKIMGLFGGGLGGLFLAGVFTRRVSSGGVILGFLASAVLLYLTQASGRVHFFLYGGIGMFSCLGVGWLASWVLPQHKDIEGLTVYGRRA